MQLFYFAFQFGVHLSIVVTHRCPLQSSCYVRCLYSVASCSRVWYCNPQSVSLSFYVLSFTVCCDVYFPVCFWYRLQCHLNHTFKRRKFLLFKFKLYIYVYIYIYIYTQHAHTVSLSLSLHNTLCTVSISALYFCWLCHICLPITCLHSYIHTYLFT